MPGIRPISLSQIQGLPNRAAAQGLSFGTFPDCTTACCRAQRPRLRATHCSSHTRLTWQALEAPWRAALRLRDGHGSA
eukprot:3098154-Prymnesium_polylepis.4